MALWNPKASSDIVAALDDLFQGRDWMPFVSPTALQVPEVTITNVRLLPYDDDLALIGFDYVNGANAGREMEYVKRGGRPMIVRHGWSALRSAVPAFTGRQLSKVYDALQTALDDLSELASR